jgi:hypothetical protein
MPELLKNRLDLITNQSLLDSVKYLETALIAGVRNNHNISLYDEEYTKLRNKIMELELIKDLIPDFIILFNDIRSCEEYISAQIYEFNERENFIKNKFVKLIDKIKNDVTEIVKFKPQTLEKFREIINEESKYRTGVELVTLFNQFGFNDNYAMGFPSRWVYTDDKLSKMKFNDIKTLMESILHPINFINTKERLQILINELNEYLLHDNLILNKDPNRVFFKPYNENLPLSALELEIDEKHIFELWNKSKNRIKDAKDFDGAITSAKSMLESVFFYILDQLEITYDKKKDNMTELYKKVATNLNMDAKKHGDKFLKQILNGIKSTFDGFIELRNTFSDAHGRTEKSYKLNARHSELAVNLAGAVAIFFYKTLKEQKSSSL